MHPVSPPFHLLDNSLLLPPILYTANTDGPYDPLRFPAPRICSVINDRINVLLMHNDLVLLSGGGHYLQADLGLVPSNFHEGDLTNICHNF